ncbi:hypothetical protein ACNSOS_04570 [Aliarcobacter vitoriensis]|uniref:Uncharacterized protein n=1 Tax=Aliarcobacter vitoriensis TaxID=2011099 RepID=A0A366MVZ3_9BACT|nr:hypothetical protein [Aliarcobacter vitoriensis]RBQ29790.1 hypothetical protein CRU91_02340 [Aliarcobacter vitoriensis]RBQ31306.1 hypothetical protein CRU92_07555 [Arcobacter sp. FW59]
METIYFFIIFIAIELFEVNWQKADTMFGLVENNYAMYEKSVFLYLGLHLSFFYSIYVAFSLSNFGFFMSSIIVLKFLEICFKLLFMQRLYQGRKLEDIAPYDVAITPGFRYFNLLIYPSCFILATFI